MRILTICSDGKGKINQQALWTGYEGNALNEIVGDLQVFVTSLNSQEGNLKDKTVKDLERQIDGLLDQINKLKHNS